MLLAGESSRAMLASARLSCFQFDVIRIPYCIRIVESYDSCVSDFAMTPSTSALHYANMQHCCRKDITNSSADFVLRTMWT